MLRVAALDAERPDLAAPLLHADHAPIAGRPPAAALEFYTSRSLLTAVQVLNNHALPFSEKHRLKVRTILSDNGREYCGRAGQALLRALPAAPGDRTPHHEGWRHPITPTVGCSLRIS